MDINLLYQQYGILTQSSAFTRKKTMALIAGLNRYFERMDSRVHKMSVLLEKVGVDVERLASQRDGQALYEAIRICRRCSVEETCGQWLSRAPDRVPASPEFCPNASRFDARG